MGVTRLLELDDVPRLVELAEQNRAFLAPWEPIRDDRYFTVAGQQELVEGLLDLYARGAAAPHVILDDLGVVAGRITVSAIQRGPFQSCRLGYWVSADRNGHGLATRAVGEIEQLAFGELGLHRIEAGTLLHNAASQRVLERNDFVRFGLAPAYLNIAGRWQDHVLYQVLSPRVPPEEGGIQAAGIPLVAGTLDGNGVRLEPVTVQRAATMVSVLHDPSLYAVTGGYPPTVIELEQRYVRQSAGISPDGRAWWLTWIVVDTATGEPAGYVQATVERTNAHSNAPGPAELAWVIGSRWQGRGLAISAASVVVAWLRQQGIQALVAHIKPGHRASEGVARRLGMHPTTTQVDDEVRWLRTVASG